MSAPDPHVREMPEEIVRLGDLTLVEYIRHIARYGGKIVEEAGLVLVRGPHPQPNPFRNAALRLTADLDPDAVLARGRALFADRPSGFVLWCREHADGDLIAVAEELGLNELERIPQLVMDAEALPPEKPLPEGVEVLRVGDAATQDDYLQVVAAAWGMGNLPSPIAAQLFFDPRIATAPHSVGFVAYREGQPLCGVMAIASHGSVLGTQGGTLEAARGLGLSQICLRLSLAHCIEHLGAQRCFAQGSALGYPVWIKFGYVPYSGHRRFLVKAPA
ncbi:MAG: hypothetical protein QOI80_756 [Solirubrobacteraceae bacterium]|jgi:hypothetical protein|nr:hypothetical protein [Solirubrobacteraceae bacterium]